MARRFWRTPLSNGAPPKPPGEVHVIAERCKGCGWCVEFCPREVLKESSAWNRRGYHPPEVVDGKAVDCAECHFCELLCPEFAIFVTKEEEAVAAGAPAALPGGGLDV